MGIAERKERDKQEMRKSIIDAAMHMFMYEGYDNVSIRKLADKIEYSPATIYLYYKDKDELLYDVQAVCFGRLVDVFTEHATSTDPIEKLRQIGHAYLTFGMENPQLYELMFIMKAPMNTVEENELWKNGDCAFNFLVDCMTQCVMQNRIHFHHPLQGVLSVWAMAHGLMSLSVCYRMKVTRMTDEESKANMYMALDHYIDTLTKK